MNYKELKEICETNKIRMADLAEAIEMTPAGVISAFDNQTLPIKKVMAICSILAITPNKFFGVEDKSGDVVYGNQNKQGRKQIINNDSATVKILQDQLAIKDAQIEKLMNMLAAK